MSMSRRRGGTRRSQPHTERRSCLRHYYGCARHAAQVAHKAGVLLPYNCVQSASLCIVSTVKQFPVRVGRQLFRNARITYCYRSAATVAPRTLPRRVEVCHRPLRQTSSRECLRGQCGGGTAVSTCMFTVCSPCLAIWSVGLRPTTVLSHQSACALIASYTRTASPHSRCRSDQPRASPDTRPLYSVAPGSILNLAMSLARPSRSIPPLADVTWYAGYTLARCQDIPRGTPRLF